jgi:ankyrin repeat protein
MKSIFEKQAFPWMMLSLCLAAATVRGVDYDSALLEAVEAGDIQRAVESLDKGADLETRNKEGWTPLIIAIRKRSPDLARELVARGADVNGQSSSAIGSTVIHFATELDDPSFMNLLVRKGARVNALARNGHTPLYSAVINGKLKAALFLCSKGADTNAVIRNEHGRSYSMFFAAALSNNTNLLQMFWPSDDRVDKRNNTGSTALMEAAKQETPDVLRYLIAHGADVNAAGSHGHTALVYAGYNGQVENIKILLAAGADPWATATDSEDPDDPRGRYGAVSLAVQQNHPEAAQLLREAQSKKPQPQNPFGERSGY